MGGNVGETTVLTCIPTYFPKKCRRWQVWETSAIFGHGNQKEVVSNGYTGWPFFLFSAHPLSQFLGPHGLPEPPLHRHGTDIPPPPVQVAGSLLDGVTLGIRGTGVTVVQKDLAEVEDRGHACAVLLDVSLKLLWGRSHALFKTSATEERKCSSIPGLVSG